VAREHIRKWQIGDVEVVRLVEVWDHTDPFEVLLPGVTPERAKQYDWMIPYFATPEGAMKLNFQAFALRSGNERIMIDTCIGNDRAREYDIFTNMQTTFMEDLASCGYTPDNITKVLCTHLHFDHVGWNTHKVGDKWVPTFPKARYLFGKKEYDHWMHLKATGGYHDFEHLHDSIDPVIEAGLVDFIGPDIQLTDEVSIFPSPGHTPGHVSVAIKSKGQEAIITGDMMHHPCQIAHPDWSPDFDTDKKAAAATRRAMLKDWADQPILVIGTHFSAPTAGHVVKDGDTYRFDPV
jgi:glyoxylase-like metal-dependent hydrolase (beta-lactamase superfamily II)